MQGGLREYLSATSVLPEGSFLHHPFCPIRLLSISFWHALPQRHPVNKASSLNDVEPFVPCFVN